MNKRCVVNVATGRYVFGQHRLGQALEKHGFCHQKVWTDCLPEGSPAHKDVPYAFKAHALKQAALDGHTALLWADASILPIRSLEFLWEHIERDGYWIGNNGYLNGEWCCDAALPLFGMTREESLEQRHVVATAFGINLRSTVGVDIFDYYLHFAANGSFCGPWTGGSTDPRVRGHRHDQTALSVIAHRLGLSLTNSPEIFAYRGGETEQTVLLADGAY